LIESHLKNELSLCVLGSSSAGNATLVWNANSAILIDCGFSPSYITRQLQRLDLSIQKLEAVFITHIHSDHINEWTVGRFVQAEIPIYCPPTVEPLLRKKFGIVDHASHKGLLRAITKSEVGLNEFSVRHFEVPHDSDGGCYGYNVYYDAGGKTKKVSIATDIAYPTDSAESHMADSDVVVLESNYDLQMLEESSRPSWLKRRIREEGHLSNDQCAESVLHILERSKSLPKGFALAHVSKECNTNKLARECTEKALAREGINGMCLFETHPDKASCTITV
jgi:phosphoribosyl 1,2-cyclic phosphodiesterase